MLFRSELNLRRPIYRQISNYGQLGREDVDISWEKTLVTVYPGASPERVESEVSDVLQNSLTVPGVSKITATSVSYTHLTGLLELPIMPTIRAETVEKKKPKMPISRAPSGRTGRAGASQMMRMMSRMPPRIKGMGRSFSVREVPEALPFSFIILPKREVLQPAVSRSL